MTGSPRRFEGSRVRRESDERKSIGTAIYSRVEERARGESEDYDSAFLRGRRRRGRWCRSCGVRRAKEQGGDGDGGGERRRAETTQRESREEKVAKGGNKRRSRMSGN